MSGPSGKNTKASKIDRVLARQVATDARLDSIDGVAKATLRRIDRMFAQQTAIDSNLINAEATLRLNHETDQAQIKRLTDSVERLTNSLKLATETAHRLEAENDRLRKYLGSVLFARRQLEASIDPPLTHLIPALKDSLEILGPLINDLPQGRLTRPICSCKAGECRGYQQYCRHNATR